MTLTERITYAVWNDPRLRAIPRGVIEDVLIVGLGWLSDHVPMETKAADLPALDFEACEACFHLIDPADPAGAVVDPEGIWLCNACAVEAKPEKGRT
jgi:hypothetical protein